MCRYDICSQMPTVWIRRQGTGIIVPPFNFNLQEGQRIPGKFVSRVGIVQLSRKKPLQA